ncbi:MAG: hypothetical protein ACI90V_004403, partial [Bacillariaceae sp.]
VANNFDSIGSSFLEGGHAGDIVFCRNRVFIDYIECIDCS